VRRPKCYRIPLLLNHAQPPPRTCLLGSASKMNCFQAIAKAPALRSSPPRDSPADAYSSSPSPPRSPSTCKDRAEGLTGLVEPLCEDSPFVRPRWRPACRSRSRRARTARETGGSISDPSFVPWRSYTGRGITVIQETRKRPRSSVATPGPVARVLRVDLEFLGERGARLGRGGRRRRARPRTRQHRTWLLHDKLLPGAGRSSGVAVRLLACRHGAAGDHTGPLHVHRLSRGGAKTRLHGPAPAEAETRPTAQRRTVHESQSGLESTTHPVS